MHSDPILRRRQVEAEIGRSRSSIYRLMELPESDPLHLPRPKKIGQRAVGWPRSWIDEWKRRQPQLERPG